MLLGSEWDALDEPVRLIHGDAPRLHARGEADVGGAANIAARLLRRVVGLPVPGTQRSLEFSIEREGAREVWKRNFAGSIMRSVLDPVGNHLREQLGPMAFLFDLHRDGDAIDWKLRGTRLLGVPLPWLLLGVAVYPWLLVLAWWYVRRAERNEAAFVELVERPEDPA